MRVLVTGATGFVGLHTALALAAAGHRVRLLVRNREKMQRLCATHRLATSELRVADINDREAVDDALAGCDGLMHCAALVSLNPGEEAAMRDTNVGGTRTVIGAAIDRGVGSIVYVSSAAALFNPTLPVIDENTPVAIPRSAYARSKAEADHYVRHLIAEGANIAMTYPTGVVGPDDPGMSEANHSLRFILRVCHVNTSAGLQMIDVRDLARAHVRLLERRDQGLWLAAGHYMPWRELGERLERVTGRRLLALPVPGAAMRGVGRLVDLASRVRPLAMPLTSEAMAYATRWVRCDDGRLRRELGLEYRPPEQTLADTIRWLARAGHIDAKWATNINSDG